MRRVIIESPYAGAVKRNMDYLQVCIRDCIARGEAPFAPHQMYTEALSSDVPEERLQGTMAGENWRRVADATVVYVDYGISPGMASGIHHAKAIPGHALEFRRIFTCD